MTDYTRPSTLPVWAESGDTVQPTNPEIQTGWPPATTPPSRQRFNWILNFLSNAVRYLLQIGISEWSATENYRVGSRVQYANKTYRSLTGNINKQPDSNASDWEFWGYSASDIQPKVDSKLTKSVAGNTDVTLTAAEADNGIFIFTGALTGDINVIVPNSSRRWVVQNATTGSHTLSVKTNSGSAKLIDQSATSSVAVFCDGSNGVFITGSSGSFLPLSGGQMSGPLKKSLGTAIASATTIDLSARAGGDVLHITGTAAISNITLGAGDVVVAIADAALPLTAGANLLIDGVASGATYTCSANDRIVFIGDSSSKVHVQIIPYAGYGTAKFLQVAAVDATGKTSVDFTSLPSWVKRATVLFYEASTNGSSNKLVQLGSGTIQTTGYHGTCNNSGTGSANYTTGFGISSATAADVLSGDMTISNVGSNVWVSKLNLGGVNGAYTVSGGGDVSLSGTLDRIRVTTVGGTDAYDNGLIGLLCEG